MSGYLLILLLGIALQAFTIPTMHSEETLSQLSTIDALMQGKKLPAAQL